MTIRTIKIKLLEGSLKTLSLFPLPLLHFIGIIVGTIFYLLPSRYRRGISNNLRLAFNDLSKISHQILLWRNLCEYGKGGLELPYLWFRDREKLLDMVKSEHRPTIKALATQQQGVLMLAVHVGAFYLMPLVVDKYWAQFAYIYKPQKGILEEILKKRTAKLKCLPYPSHKSSVSKLYHHITAGGHLGMTCDRNAKFNAGISAPLFNMQTSTMKLPLRLAKKLNAPVYFATMQRLSFGRGYYFHLAKLDDRIYDKDLKQAACYMNAEVEKVIRLFPSQYMWYYQRFNQNKP